MKKFVKMAARRIGQCFLRGASLFNLLFRNSCRSPFFVLNIYRIHVNVSPAHSSGSPESLADSAGKLR